MKFFSPTPRNSFPAAERSGARAFLFLSSRVPIQKSGWRRGLPQIPLWARARSQKHTLRALVLISRDFWQGRASKESAKLLWMSRESEWVSCAKKGCVNCTFGISQAAGGKSPEPRCVLHSEFCLLFQARSVWRQGLQTPSSRLGNNQLSLIIVSWFWHNLGIHCQLKLNLRKKNPSWLATIPQAFLNATKIIFSQLVHNYIYGAKTIYLSFVCLFWGNISLRIDVSVTLMRILTDAMPIFNHGRVYKYIFFDVMLEDEICLGKNTRTRPLHGGRVFSICKKMI